MKRYFHLLALLTQYGTWANHSFIDVTKAGQKNSGVTTFSVLGNHDHVRKAEGKMEQRDEPGATTDNNHLFKYTPSSTVKSVEVRVQDRWGESHSEKLSW